MILTIPYNPTLPGGYDKLVSSITRFGKHPMHTLFVVSLPQHEDGAFDLAMRLREYFGRYFAVTVPAAAQPESGTHLSNRMFTAAVDALRSYEPTEQEMPDPVMLYHDPLWRPMKVRWLDEFQAEYYIAGAPDTFGLFQSKGDKARVEGPVAVSRKFLAKTDLLPFLSGETHWREFLAWEFIRNGLPSTAIGRTLPAYIRP